MILPALAAICRGEHIASVSLQREAEQALRSHAVPGVEGRTSCCAGFAVLLGGGSHSLVS
jgi:hypothetical protein